MGAATIGWPEACLAVLYLAGAALGIRASYGAGDPGHEQVTRPIGTPRMLAVAGLAAMAYAALIPSR